VPTASRLAFRMARVRASSTSTPSLEPWLAEGCENDFALWRELRGVGVPGGNKQVHRWLAEPRTVPAKVGRRCDQSLDDAQAATAHGKEPLLPAPRQLAWLLVQPAAELGMAEARACRIPAIETFAARLEVDDAGGCVAFRSLEQRPARGTGQPAQAAEPAMLRPH